MKMHVTKILCVVIVAISTVTIIPITNSGSLADGYEVSAPTPRDIWGDRETVNPLVK